MISFKNISIIIPVSPEETALQYLMQDLRCIVNEADIRIVPGSCRAQQLNTGARESIREYLWFLHADSRLSPAAFDALLTSLNAHPTALHYFRLKFMSDGPPWMWLNEIGCYLRSRLLGVPFGDQGFCISRDVFNTVGGFHEHVAYGEDHVFVLRAKKRGVRLRYIPSVLKTSARRYQSVGWAKLTWRYKYLWLKQAWSESVLHSDLRKRGEDQRAMMVSPPVIPAKAGIHSYDVIRVDPRLRGDDKGGGNDRKGYVYE